MHLRRHTGTDLTHSVHTKAVQAAWPWLRDELDVAVDSAAARAVAAAAADFEVIRPFRTSRAILKAAAITLAWILMVCGALAGACAVLFGAMDDPISGRAPVTAIAAGAGGALFSAGYFIRRACTKPRQRRDRVTDYR
jgi:hypothetical protein